jgi:thiamine biosynthesis lipoprotein
MKHLCRSLLLALALTSLSCNKSPELVKIEGFAQGTTYHITYEPTTTTKPADIEKAISDEFKRIDKVFSNYRDDSSIELFNAQKTTDPLTVDPELVALIEQARNIYSASNGCYDLTIKPLFDLWGFKKDVFNPPSDDLLAQTLHSVGMNKLETLDNQHLRKQHADLRVDVSSIGQGYTVHKIAQLIEHTNVKRYMVEIGGELQIAGLKPDGTAWRIALEKPLPDERKLYKIAQFDSGKTLAMMTSGTYRHFFDSNGKRYSHILNARTGKPIDHPTVSVTVLHPNATLADAWSTALLNIANQHKIAALFIDEKSGELVESRSDSLIALTDVTFHQP